MNDDERVGPSKLFTILCGRVTPAEGPAAKRGGGGAKSVYPGSENLQGRVFFL